MYISKCQCATEKCTERWGWTGGKAAVSTDSTGIRDSTEYLEIKVKKKKKAYVILHLQVSL